VEPPASQTIRNIVADVAALPMSPVRAPATEPPASQTIRSILADEAALPISPLEALEVEPPASQTIRNIVADVAALPMSPVRAPATEPPASQTIRNILADEAALLAPAAAPCAPPAAAASQRSGGTSGARKIRELGVSDPDPSVVDDKARLLYRMFEASGQHSNPTPSRPQGSCRAKLRASAPTGSIFETLVTGLAHVPAEKLENVAMFGSLFVAASGVILFQWASSWMLSGATNGVMPSMGRQ